MNIKIEVIPHGEQRYPTVGDWFYGPNGDLTIKVSSLGDWKMESLIALHELVEALLCKSNEVSQADVDTFDFQFEKGRSACNKDEPGDSSTAPYVKEHCIATGMERIVCAELGVFME